MSKGCITSTLCILCPGPMYIFPNSFLILYVSKHRDKQRSCFTPSINVDNVFNRCVMFDPKTWHSADNFFGTTLDDSRLTLVFYAQAGKR